MAESVVGSQVQALLTPAEPALAEAYFAQVRHKTTSSACKPLKQCLIPQGCISQALTVLQVTQALGGHLQVRETPDKKGRGVFTTQVLFPSVRLIEQSICFAACQCTTPVKARSLYCARAGANTSHVTLRLLRKLPCERRSWAVLAALKSRGPQSLLWESASTNDCNAESHQSLG